MIGSFIHTEGLQALSQKLSALLPGGAGYDNAMRTAANNALAKVKQRIHQQGLTADGSSIGTYSVRPIYISTATGAGKGLTSPVGKTGKSTFVTGKKKGQPHTSKYFAGGYGQFKTAIGLADGGKVNLYLTGALCKQLLVIGRPGNGYGLGWSDEKLTALAQALEHKYGKEIWGLSEVEKKEITNVLTCECVNVLK